MVMWNSCKDDDDGGDDADVIVNHGNSLVCATVMREEKPGDFSNSHFGVIFNLMPDIRDCAFRYGFTCVFWEYSLMT